MVHKRKFENDYDSGAIIIWNTKRNHWEVQKNDERDRFKSDAEAWKYLKPKM